VIGGSASLCCSSRRRPVKATTPAALKAAGKTRLEGKDYVVQDGDVILFRFNV